jgi:predicted PurR-regulated permease PerM
VSGWALACLAAMAIALLAMAIAQVSLAWQIARLSKQTIETTQELRREFRPIVDKLHKVADDASRATALGLAQLERVDQMLGTAALRIDETLSVVQDAIITPVRHATAVVAGLRAAYTALRGSSGGSHRVREDEDGLFIG